MKNRKLKIGVFITILFLSKTVVYAQYGPTFTQYTFNEAFINPAYIGSQDALAVNASYRNQWVGIDGAPVTQTFVAHAPAFHKKIGIGITAFNDRIGVLKTTAAYLNLSYRIIMPRATLSFGLLGGIQSVREDFTKVKTIQPEDDQFMHNTPRVISPNMGFGAYYYTRKLYVGLSVPRLMQTVYGSDSSKALTRVNVKDFSYYAALGYVFDANENVIWKPYILTKIIQGAPIQADFALTALLHKVLWAGASYRTDHTLSGIIGIQMTPQFKLSYSYDYTFSELQKYHSGSHEVQLSYIFSFNKEKIVTPRLF